ncbi:surface lipoprotein assembly modifier [Pseudorhodobacter sp.]|uniref:surface lipoprotein assembly modifier n=1 Tax=Pseudorhodobacter sp. TaxID=1934400 RepID=UPI002647AA09|nr:surface lipoprotein assembly modifier [Pseudorhodobacter sp.]MDN5788245.1 surface lipoprotein assembly modifier [Pseudorhodobacter sp.]
MFKHRLAVALLATLTAMPVAALAKPTSPRALLQVGDFDGARASLAQLTAGDPKAGLHRMFLEGLILIHQSDPRGAAAMFRKILAEAPDYQPARRELSATLYVLGDSGAAKFHAEQLLALTSDDRIRATAQAIINSSQAGKPSGVSLRFALLPSSNQSKGTTADEVIIGGIPFKVDPASKAVSGTAAAVGATLWRRWDLGEYWTGTASLGLDAKIYAGKSPTELTFGPRFDFSYSKAGTRFSVGPGIEFKRQGGATIRKRVGVNTSFQSRLAENETLDFSAMAMRQTYPGQDYRNGWIVGGRLGLSYVVSPSLRLYAGLPFEREKTGRVHLDHSKLGLTLGLDKLWKGGLYTGISASIESDRYAGLFPGLAYARHDKVQTLSLSLRHSKFSFGKFTPEITYSFTRQKSNVAFFDYRSHDLSIGLSTNF